MLADNKNIKVMGIINATDDSYYPPNRVIREDGTADIDKLVKLISEMVAGGADILDIGACSSRPGSISVEADVEWNRLKAILPIIKSIIGKDIPISIDTFNSSVVERVYDSFGPFIVNDISAGLMDKNMLNVTGRLGLPYIAMHMRGTPLTMNSKTDYGDIVSDIIAYFRDFESRALEAGIKDWWLDPGFGFAKQLPQNYTILRRLDEFKVFDRPIVVGVSRKSMIYKLLGKPPEEVLPPTQAVHMAALERGATVLRVHDVNTAHQTVVLYKAMMES